MKRTIKNYAQMLCTITLITLGSCNETDEPKVCIEPPCGTVDSNATNVTLLIQNDLDIGMIGISVDNQITALSLSGRDLENAKPFTCWQTVPTITSTTSVVLGYELEGETIIGALNVSNISSNQLVVEIDGDAASIADYNACNDTP